VTHHNYTLTLFCKRVNILFHVGQFMFMIYVLVSAGHLYVYLSVVSLNIYPRHNLVLGSIPLLSFSPVTPVRLSRNWAILDWESGAKVPHTQYSYHVYLYVLVLFAIAQSSMPSVSPFSPVKRNALQCKNYYFQV
jgi:hypothetical protein